MVNTSFYRTLSTYYDTYQNGEADFRSSVLTPKFRDLLSPHPNDTDKTPTQSERTMNTSVSIENEEKSL
jgi:hypothetical protein